MPTTRSLSSPSALSAATPRRFRPLKRAGRFSPLPHPAEARFRTRTGRRKGCTLPRHHGPDGKRPFLSRGGGVFALARPWPAESRAGSEWGLPGLRKVHSRTLQQERPARAVRAGPARRMRDRKGSSAGGGTDVSALARGRRSRVGGWGIRNGRPRPAEGACSHSHVDARRILERRSDVPGSEGAGSGTGRPGAWGDVFAPYAGMFQDQKRGIENGRARRAGGTSSHSHAGALPGSERAGSKRGV